MIRSVLTVAAVLTLGATAVIAQAQDPIAERQQLMKGVGGQARTGALMVRGEAPFDQAKALAVFATFSAAGEKLPALFPDSSKTGGETAAAPAIWTNMPDFKARAEKFAADSKAAQASVKDLDTFKAAFATAGRNCGGCHEVYRLKK